MSVLKGLSRFKMGAQVKHRFFLKSLAFVNGGIQEVCFSIRYFSREFDSGMVFVSLFNEL